MPPMVVLSTAVIRNTEPAGALAPLGQPGFMPVSARLVLNSTDSCSGNWEAAAVLQPSVVLLACSLSVKAGRSWAWLHRVWL